MLGLRKVSAALFGPSPADVRAAVAAYLDELRNNIPGETLPDNDIARDYESLRRKFGWPPLTPADLGRELDALGMQIFPARKVPWANRSTRPALPTPIPATVAPPPEPEQQATAATEPPWPPLPVAPSAAQASPVETLKAQPSPPRRRSYVQRDDALVDLIQRLERGEAMPSQQSLADEWGVNKGAVSKWFKSWEQAGLLSRQARIRDGRCNVIHLPTAEREARAA